MNANRFEAFQSNEIVDDSDTNVKNVDDSDANVKNVDDSDANVKNVAESDASVKNVAESDTDSNNVEDSDTDEELDREIANELNELDLSFDNPCLFVLTNSNGYPIYCSASRPLLVAERSDLVQQAIAEYSTLGRCYVSYETNDEEDICTISCMQRNLFWTTERVLESYTIYCVPKI